MVTTGRTFGREHKDPPDKLPLYKVGPPGDLVDRRHSRKIHEILKKIEGRVNRHYSTRRTGRIRCQTEDYKIFISRFENSLIIHVKSRETGRVLLSHRIRTGQSIIV